MEQITVRSRARVPAITCGSSATSSRLDRHLSVLGGPAVPQRETAEATSLIAAKHAALGGPGGLLGTTTTAVSACPDGVGFFRHYQQGSIYWHPLTGAHEVHGALRRRFYRVAGAATSRVEVEARSGRLIRRADPA